MLVDEQPSVSYTRFIAVDLHKHYLYVGGIDHTQRIVLQPRKVPIERWPAWAEAHLLPSDAVVIEATTNAWHIYDHLLPLVGKLVVADARQVKQIATTATKTDRHDVLILAQLLRADIIPAVWAGPCQSHSPSTTIRMSRETHGGSRWTSSSIARCLQQLRKCPIRGRHAASNIHGRSS